MKRNSTGFAKKVLPLAAVLLMGMASAAFAKPLQRTYLGTRPLGMGGAFTALADDGNALYYNPAGLNKIQNWSFAIINPAVEWGKDTKSFYDDTQDADLSDSIDVANLLRDHMGEDLHARVTYSPYFVMKNFGVGLLGSAQADVQPHNVAYPEAQVDARGVAGVQVGGAMPIIEDQLRLGAALKFMRGWKLDETYTVVDIAEGDFGDRVKDDLGSGSGFGFDLGAIYTFKDVPLAPSVGMALQNVFDTRMGDGGKIPMQVNVGASVTHDVLDWLTVNAAADIVDITGNTDAKGESLDLSKRLHVGLETWLTKRLGLRAGLYQGNFTYGATLDLWVLKAEYACYAEELGAKGGSRDDRRQVIQVSLGW